MSITAKPWKDAPDKYMVTVYFKWPSGEPYRDRKIIDAKNEKQAIKWGEQRKGELLARGQYKVEAEKAEARPGEVVTKWFGRYYDAAEKGVVGKKNKGRPQVNVDDRRARFKNWIERDIGHLEMTKVTAKDLRAIVATLDAEVIMRRDFYAGVLEREENGGKPGMASKTAAHIWSEITSGFREAASSKAEDLRIEGLIDPTMSVQPPLRTDERTQVALYPAEVVQLLACEDIPLSRRRCYALSIYTGTRLSEMANLAAVDIDFEHGMITVRGTKTRAALRRTPIEPSLLPLLKKLVKERPTGALIDAPRADGKGGASDLMKADLETAKLTRSELYADTEFMAPYTFHANRHTAITHAYIAGKDETYLKLVYGHTLSAMTRRYLDAAAIGRVTFGKPFPELPPSVLGGATVLPLRARTA